MIEIGSAVDNRTICDLFGVANMGGIRVSTARNHIVLISNNTDPLYRNEWRDDVLHFVGMGSKGPQKLDRQNRTLANTIKSGAAIHLFEVFEKSRYVYTGEVELADEPYMSGQRDARADDRFVWIFPLRRKKTSAAAAVAPDARMSNHLPYGAYAVIGSDLNADQIKLVDEALDRLKQAGVPVVDQRDVDLKRYHKSQAVWHENVLDQVRSIAKELIRKRKRTAKDGNRDFGLVDDELRISSASSEQELRDALKFFLDRDDPAAMNEVFDEAMRRVRMPDVPKSLEVMPEPEPLELANLKEPGQTRIDRARFLDFT